MSTIFQVGATCYPSQRASDTYVYAIVPTTQNGLATITSAGELLVIDGQSLAESSILRLQDVPEGVCCLTSGDDTKQTTLCCGADGIVATHDIRTQARASYFRVDKAPTALARKSHQIAVGTELSNHQAVVSVWDQRQNRQIWQHSENNDDITALSFHPTRENLLLAGGDDGQVGLFDTSINEEEDSLIQGVNHGPIHKAGFLGDHRFFALSSDQNFSVYTISSPGDEEDPQPTVFGDVRHIIPCEYVIDVFQTGEGFAVAAGSNISETNVRIVELEHATSARHLPKLKTKSGYMLEGAHGEEVVRSVFADDDSGTIFTAGEDGAIRAFRQGMATNIYKTSDKVTKGKKTSDVRYKPY